MDTPRHEGDVEGNATGDKIAKAPYESPTLTRHGALTEVTAQGFSAINNPKVTL